MDLETYCASTVIQSARSSKSTTDQQLLQELLDLSLNKLTGVYKCTPEKMLFEMTDLNFIARAEINFSKRHLNYKVITFPFQECSISYYASVVIYHSAAQFSIKIPTFRSYNPTGLVEYLTSAQFVFLLKLTSAMLKAAVSGAPEEELVFIKNSVSQFTAYESNSVMIDYMYIQVKLACYRLIMPPSFPEYICAKAMKGLILRDDAKEYLESYLMYIKGEISATCMPIEYFTAVLTTDKKLSWELKEKFTELESKGSKAGRMLKNLPSIVEEFNYVEPGDSYVQLEADINKLSNEFEKTVESFNQCAIM